MTPAVRVPAVRAAAGLARLAPAPLRRAASSALHARDLRAAATLVPRLPADRRAGLLIGPTNTAGQARQWARAAQQHLAGVAARNMMVERNGTLAGFGYGADVVVPTSLQYHGLPAWERGVLRTFSHLLLEMGRGVTAEFFSVASEQLLRRYAQAGARVAVVLHGSEIRDHARHAARYPASPFAARSDYLNLVQARVEETREFLDRVDLPLFVTTPDMLDFVDGASYLPVTIDVDGIMPDGPALARDVPIFLHAPSRPVLKGSDAVDAVLGPLADDGRIVYRRVEGVSHRQMAQLVADADVVVDQIVLGNVGVLAAEAMAAGRLVVSHTLPEVRERFGADFPVPDATPPTLEPLVRDILGERERYAAIAAAGPSWAREHHDGRAAAAALAGFLGS